MAVPLHRWGMFAARRRRAVLAAWLVLMAAVIALGVRAAGEFTAETDIPGSQAQSALTEMNRHFPSSEHQSAQIVFETPEDTSFKYPAMAEAMGKSLTAAATVPGVTSVTDPTATGTVSPDGRTAVAQVRFGAAEHEAVPEDDLDALKDTAESSRAAGIDVLFGGDAYRESGSPGGPAEALGLLVAPLVLAVTFGQLLSAGMPLLMAVLAVGTGLAALTGLAATFDIYEKAPSLALMLGLAVGIDYALFILARHRSELPAGRDVEEAATRATATAGSAVAFAGLTVIIALVGLSITGVPALTTMGLGAALTVAASVVMPLFLMPALLSVAGGRLRPAADSRAARRERQADDSAAEPPMGVRWAETVVRHPWRATVAVVLLLGALALPATQLALPDDGSEATSTAVRQSYDKVADSFGAGANGPLVVLVSDAADGTLRSTGEQVAAELDGVDGIARISPAEYSQDGATARVQVIPETGPRDAETTELVTELEDRLAPLARAIRLHAPDPVHVTGDAPRLQQVLNNLIGNALQHTPADAAIDVTLTGGRDGRAVLRVADSGPGIAPEELSRVYDRFWRAGTSRGRAGGGSGLGLSIVRAVVHAHHGSVDIASEPNSGTTVTVTLPARVAEKSSAAGPVRD
ncbi:MMPL family transporter [Streptomyces sp. NPDC000348]|uniref:MMPL family transporter n=1 Tax=Streptomyces sp. NPDC000348 TaxID=3364538 RepID=UPI00367ABAF9